MTVAGGGRRPNSSLGTESGGGRHQQRRDGGPGPVDMEEIFRSVLEDGGAAARQKVSKRRGEWAWLTEICVPNRIRWLPSPNLSNAHRAAKWSPPPNSSLIMIS
jgi:hypothetical protein